MANTTITAQQRALLFGANTRKHIQMLGSQTVTAGGNNISFTVPKARLLQSIRLLCTGVVKLPAAVSTIGDLDFYKLISRVAVNFNNGFAPIALSGEELARLSMLRQNPGSIIAKSDDTTLCNYSVGATDGTNKPWTFDYVVEIPLTLNERDPVGLILAQNAESTISCSVDVALATVLNANAVFDSFTVTPSITSFSIPAQSEAFPDLSVLKVCDSRNESIIQGVNTIKLATGMIYRKMLICLTDGSGNALTPSDITGNFELLLNTADVPYSISPAMLKKINVSELGYKLPAGMYVFDFTYQGFTNMGGSRDYIDTESITTFELRFNSTKAGKATIISEKISRLIQG